MSVPESSSPSFAKQRWIWVLAGLLVSVSLAAAVVFVYPEELASLRQEPIASYSPPIGELSYENDNPESLSNSEDPFGAGLDRHFLVPENQGRSLLQQTIQKAESEGWQMQPLRRSQKDLFTDGSKTLETGLAILRLRLEPAKDHRGAVIPGKRLLAITLEHTL